MDAKHDMCKYLGRGARTHLCGSSGYLLVGLGPVNPVSRS